MKLGPRGKKIGCDHSIRNCTVMQPQKVGGEERGLEVALTFFHIWVLQP